MASSYEEYSGSIFVVRNAMSSDLCEELIAMSEERGYGEAPITTARGPVLNKDMRNNNRVIVDSFDLADQLWPLVADYIPEMWHMRKKIGLNERFRFYRYDPGEQFDWHYDGYFRRDNDEKSQFTCMFYLNDNFEGGTTDFANCSVVPGRGDALLFYHHQSHRGAPVLSGRKYVIRTDVMYSPEIAV